MVAEHGVLARHDEIAGEGEARAETDGVAVHLGDHWLLHLQQHLVGAVHALGEIPIVARRVSARFRRSGRWQEKGIARSSDDHDSHGIVMPQCRQRGADLDMRAGESLAVFRLNLDGCDLSVAGDRNRLKLGHWLSPWRCSCLVMPDKPGHDSVDGLQLTSRGMMRNSNPAVQHV